MTEHEKKSGRFSKQMAGLRMGLVALCVFFLFVYFGDPGRGLVAGLSFIAITTAMYACWRFHRARWFWALMVVIVGLHAALVFLRSWPYEYRPVQSYAPLVILDFIAIVFALHGAAKLMGQFQKRRERND